PRRNFAVQRLLRQVGSRDSEAGEMGRQRRTSGSGEILRSKDVRRLYLEAHAGFLFLRRLRAVLGQLPGQCGGKAVVATIHYRQGERLRISAVFIQKTKSGHAPPAELARKSARCWWNTSTRSSICGAA